MVSFKAKKDLTARHDFLIELNSFLLLYIHTGYTVKADTLIFLNNYDLNMSTALWEMPEKFEPKRFLSNGKLIKPDHFIPFGVGRRSCMGYKLVQFLSFSIVANLLKEFDIRTINGDNIKVPLGSLALTENPYRFIFTQRN